MDYPSLLLPACLLSPTLDVDDVSWIALNKMQAKHPDLHPSSSDNTDMCIQKCREPIILKDVARKVYKSVTKDMMRWIREGQCCYGD